MKHAKANIIFVFFIISLNFLMVKLGMDQPAIFSLNIFFLAIYLWATELIHASITGLLIFCLIPVLGILTPAATFQVMGDLIIWRLVGIFIITKGMEKTGLARRMALHILTYARGNLHVLLFLMELITFIFVFIVPNATARTAILATICMGLVMKLDKGLNTNFAKAVSLTIPITSLTTSNTIIVGASATIYAAGFFEKNLHTKFSYLSWLQSMLPGNIVLLIAIFFIIIWLFPFPSKVSDNNIITEEIKLLGRISRDEWKMIIFLVLLLLAWFCGFDSQYPVEFIVSTLLLMPYIGVLERKETFKTLDWETVILFGAGLAMAESLNKTAAIDFLIKIMSHNTPDLNEPLVILLIILITVLVRLGMSNMTGLVAALLPVFTSLSLALGFNPVWACTICVIGSGFGILMPPQSASNLATYCYGFYTPRDLLKAGSLVIAADILIIIAVSRYYWPLLGLVSR